MGQSFITTYIKIAAGVSDGRRTDIMLTTTGILFLLSILFVVAFITGAIVKRVVGG